MKQNKMIVRLLEMRRRAADAAELEHANAHQIAATAAEACERAERAFSAALDARDEIGTAADLEDKDRLKRSLRQVFDAAGRALVGARAREATARSKMTDARIEARRFETWLTNEAERAAIEGKRVQQLADDEVAARKRRQA